MRLSDIKGDACIDVIAEIIEPISNIASSDAFKEIFKSTKGTTKDEFKSTWVSKVKTSLPTILKLYKEDVITILSALSMKTKEEYVESMTMMSLVNDAFELITDKSTMSLFMSAQSQEQEQSFGDVQEHSEDEA